jgi:hypothetical protein
VNHKNHLTITDMNVQAALPLIVKVELMSEMSSRTLDVFFKSESITKPRHGGIAGSHDCQVGALCSGSGARLFG